MKRYIPRLLKDHAMIETTLAYPGLQEYVKVEDYNDVVHALSELYTSPPHNEDHVDCLACVIQHLAMTTLQKARTEEEPPRPQLDSSGCCVDCGARSPALHAADCIYFAAPAEAAQCSPTDNKDSELAVDDNNEVNSKSRLKRIAVQSGGELSDATEHGNKP